MPFVCRTGLFVGVDEYEYLPTDAWLHRAGADAAKMFDYFRAAIPEGAWEMLIEDDEVLLRRADFFEGFSRWLQSIDVSHTALLYFSGHAEVIADGLVLAAADYRPGISYDTGIPLHRVTRLMRQRPDCQFLLLLDCCRSGNGATLGDDIPPHVSVIYACPHGGKAFEGEEHGGLLGRAMLDVLHEFGSEHREVASISVQTLFSRLHNRLTRHGIRTSFEMLGGSPGSIEVPVLTSGLVSQRRPAAPDCMMKTRELSISEQHMRLQRVRAAIRAFRGQIDSDADICNLEDERIRVNVPTDGVSWSCRPFVEHLIRTDDTFVELAIKWNRAVPASVIESNARSEGLDVTYPMGSTKLMHLEWKEGKRIGYAYVDLSRKRRVVMRITSPSKSGLWPLKQLQRLPGLFDVFRSM